MSPALRIADFQALTFDCYGTLIDWERGIRAHLDAWARRRGLTVDLDALLGVFAESETAIERDAPALLYRDVLRRVHGAIAAAAGVEPTDADARAFADSVGDWPPFPDTRAALAALAGRYRLVIVSNVDHRSFASSARQLGVDLDACVLAEDVGAYKPDARMFERAFEVLGGMGIGRQAILHVAQSLYHDHVPARALGLRTVWVDRRRGSSGTGATLPPPAAVAPDLVVSSLAELVALDDRQRAG
jgi:2-haloalkanoic acid dehalogenase type II